MNDITQNTYTIVVVKYLDASFQLEEATDDEIEPHCPMLCAGLLVADEPDHVSLAIETYADDHERRWRRIQHIPRAMIVAMDRFEVYEPGTIHLGDIGPYGTSAPFWIETKIENGNARHRITPEPPSADEIKARLDELPGFPVWSPILPSLQSSKMQQGSTDERDAKHREFCERLDTPRIVGYDRAEPDKSGTMLQIRLKPGERVTRFTRSKRYTRRDTGSEIDVETEFEITRDGEVRRVPTSGNTKVFPFEPDGNAKLVVERLPEDRQRNTITLAAGLVLGEFTTVRQYESEAGHMTESITYEVSESGLRKIAEHYSGTPRNRSDDETK